MVCWSPSAKDWATLQKVVYRDFISLSSTKSNSLPRLIATRILSVVCSIRSSEKFCKVYLSVFTAFIEGEHPSVASLRNSKSAYFPEAFKLLMICDFPSPALPTRRRRPPPCSLISSIFIRMSDSIRRSTCRY